MVSNPPKVSFIPKGPIAREESFMERRRPRSITGFLAIFVFIASVGSYGGLYFYDDTISKEVAKKAESITSAQREFTQAPEIAKAKVFRARADLAKELLDQHIVVSPVFAFLSNNTLGSILYSSFSFKRDGGIWALSLGGEAPSYASLAYQADVLRKKVKENELVDFSVDNIALTDSGTVTFDLSVNFAQSQLSYTKTQAAAEKTAPATEEMAPALAPEPIPSVSENAAPSVSLPPVESPATSPATPPALMTATTTPEITPSFGETGAGSGWTVAPVVETSSVSPAPAPAPTPAPKTNSFWSWFKFW